MSRQDEGISNSDFVRLRDLIYAQSGINLSADKKTMLELRIKRRVRSLDLNSFAQYCEYLFGQQGQREEIVHLLDVVTTNKTDFFREPAHFEYLVQKSLPDLMSRNASGRELLVWSAGCSTGEEPYTLAIVLSEYGLTHAGFRFRLLATDISTTVLEKAHLAVFNTDVARPVPADLRRKYFLRGRDPASNRIRVVPELRELVEFRRVNFKDDSFGLTEKADVIFCRNVIIYFDRPTQEQILQKLARQLLPGGYFFVGHAEALHDMDLPLVPVAPAAYRKVDARS
jgi:chemotaxis protein methyltransferase CheR